MALAKPLAPRETQCHDAAAATWARDCHTARGAARCHDILQARPQRRRPHHAFEPKGLSSCTGEQPARRGISQGGRRAGPRQPPRVLKALLRARRQEPESRAESLRRGCLAGPLQGMQYPGAAEVHGCAQGTSACKAELKE